MMIQREPLKSTREFWRSRARDIFKESYIEKLYNFLYNFFRDFTKILLKSGFSVEIAKIGPYLPKSQKMAKNTIFSDFSANFVENRFLINFPLI